MRAPLFKYLIFAITVLDAGWIFAQTPDWRPAVDAQRLDAEALPFLRAQRTVSTDTAALAAATPDRVTWFQFQTPIRNQLDRNTCSIFAMLAAVEARYRRQFGLTLDLSEQYAWHVYKSGTTLDHPNRYKYENQSSYWGGGGSHGVMHLTNIAVPLDTFAPYKSQSQMDQIRKSIPAAGDLAWHPDPAKNPTTQDNVDAFEYSPSYIPIAARQNAKYGVASYVLLDQAGARDTTRLEGHIAAGNEVIVDFDIQWKADPVTGVLMFDPAATPFAHAVLLVGYDRPGGFFWVKNSWGDATYLKVDYDVFRQTAYSGAIVSSVTHPDLPNWKSRFIGVWNMNHDGWKGKLIVRRPTGEKNTPTRLGHYHAADGRRFAVNGQFIDDGPGVWRGVYFALADVEYNAPGSMSGQKFWAHLYSTDVKLAAGHTIWSGTPFGLWLTRGPDSLPFPSTFNRYKWIGEWYMNHDGWVGTLKIQRLEDNGAQLRLFGTYYDSAGNATSVTGYLEKGKEHVAQLTMVGQPFTLHYHTWSDGLFSGYTFWAGMRFGAYGRIKD
jgi:hypothetical protein